MKRLIKGSFIPCLIILSGVISSLFYLSFSTMSTFLLFSFLCAPVMTFMMIKSGLLLQQLAITLKKQHVAYYYGVVLCLCFLCYGFSRGLSNASFYHAALSLIGLMLFFMLQRAWLSTADSIKRFVMTSGSVTFFLWLSWDSLGRVIFYCFHFSVTVSLMISYMTLTICFWRLSPGYRLSRVARGDQ